MWGRATLATDVSSTSKNVADITAAAISQGFTLGRQTAASLPAREGSATSAVTPVNGRNLLPGL